MTSPPASRRTFLRRSSLLGAAASLWPSPQDSLGAAPVLSPHGTTPFSLFTKHLIGMEPAALADHVAALGFNGIEAPIRPGGHVLPERVADELPAFVREMQNSNVQLTILTSAIDAITPAQHTETILRTAAQLGIKYYRMNWFKYDLKKPLLPQLDEIRAKIKDLLALSRELGIRPLSQNHSGPAYVGAAIWDLQSIMRDFAPEDWGLAYDIMHASIVGGTSWEIQFRLARPHMGAAYFKDFTWAGKLQPKNCPLGQGMAAAPEFAKLLIQSAFTGPVVLHIEYLKAQKITTADDVKLAHEAAARDLGTLRQWFGEQPAIGREN